MCGEPTAAYSWTGSACQAFIWGGCQRGANHFDSLEACQKACDPVLRPLAVSPSLDQISAIPKPAVRFTGTCQDKHPTCGAWAPMGFCMSNARWMLLNCARSCNSCGVTRADIYNAAFPDQCADRSPHCPVWSQADQCKRNPGYMLIFCRTSCGVCSDPSAKNN